MAKFMFLISYSSEGLKGLQKDKPSGRRDAVAKAAAAAGGTLEALYFGIGEYDAYVICDFPDLATAVNCAVTVSASGLVHTKTVALLTVEEAERALSKQLAYRPPGQ